MRVIFFITCLCLQGCGDEKPSSADPGIRLQGGIDMCEKEEYKDHEFCNLEEIIIE